MNDYLNEHGVQPPGHDEESRREFGRQLAMASLLRSVLGEESSKSRARRADSELPTPRSPVLGFLRRAFYAHGAGFEGRHWRLNSFTMIASLAGLFLLLSLIAIVPAYLSMRRAQFENAQRELREEQERQLAASQALEAELAKKIAASRPKPPPLLDVYAGLLSERNPVAAARAIRSSVAWVYTHGFAQARLTFAIDCRWRGTAPDVGEALTVGRRLELRSGLAEIVFQNGARTILQGPATLRILSDKGAHLEIGRYTVNADDPQAKGFEVSTPGMKYTDLGTEFGVMVDADGEEEMHVFRGTVQANVRHQKSEISDSTSVSRPPTHLLNSPQASDHRPLVLSAHQAIRVEAPDDPGKPAAPIVTIAANSNRFVRAISQSIDLADILAGGDGTTEQTGRGIDQRTGGMVKDNLGPPGATSGNYHRVSALKFVDGVFVPNGRSGPVQLDSAGHRYALPATCGQTDHNLIARRAEPLTKKQIAASAGHIARPGILVNELLRPHSEIYLHANSGVTFDLAAIRVTHAGHRLARFQAVIGADESIRSTAIMAAWVFVNGKLCYSKPKLRLTDGYFLVDVPLDGTARYLTLVATDGNLDINSDHVLFHCPQLVMEVAAK